MKTELFVAIYTVLICSNVCIACPTCVGHVTKQSAPFFSDECYRTQKKTVTPNKQLKEINPDQKTTETTSSKNQGE